MTDDIFDWGKDSGNHLHIKPEELLPQGADARKLRQRAKLEATRAAWKAEAERREEIERKKKEQSAREIAEKNKAIEASIEEDQASTHIWFASIAGNIRNETKAITGRALPKTHYLRLLPYVERERSIIAKANRVSKSNYVITPEAANACAIRLTEQQAMKAKLSHSGKQVIVEDPDGSKWKAINNLMERMKANATDHDDSEAMTFLAKQIKALRP